VDACHQLTGLLGIPLPIIAKWPGARRYAACLTHDVDWVGQKGVLATGRIVLRTARDAAKGHWRVGAQQVRRMLAANLPGVGHDPYDNFEQYQQLEAKYNACSSFFLMVGHYFRRYGASYRLNDDLRRRIEPLAAGGWEIGLHGSYYGWDSAARIRAEKEALETFVGLPVVGGRQHYLHWRQPETWYAYHQAGLHYDSSVGYNNSAGYRTHFTFPYRPFDRYRAAEIDLWELPLTIMDAAMFGNPGVDSDVAWQLCDALVRLVAESHGLLTVLWHLRSLDSAEFPGRGVVYTQLLCRLAQENAWMTTASGLTNWWQARAQLELADCRMDGNRTTWVYCAQEPIDGIVLELFARPGLSVTTDWPAAIVRTPNAIHIEFGSLSPQQRFSVRCEQS